MAKITTRIEYSYMLNIGNYQSVKPTVALEVTVDEGEQFPSEERLSELFSKTRSYVQTQVDKELKEVADYVEKAKG